MNPLQSFRNENSEFFLRKKAKLIREVKFLFSVLFILLFIPNKAQGQIQAYKAMGTLLENPPRQSLFASHEDFQRILEQHNIKNLSEKEMEAIAYANSINNPIYLIHSLKSFFNSNAYKTFFFLHFDLHKHGDGLFTQLFTKRVDKNTRRELDLPAAQKNWENFTRSLEEAVMDGYTQIEQTDLEAAALTFIHTKLSPFRKFENYSGIARHGYTNTTWFTISIASFFHEIILDLGRYLEYYMSPHFKLDIMDPYFKVILYGVMGDESTFRSKDAIIRIWNDIKAYKIEAERQSEDQSLKFIFWSEEISLTSRLEEHIQRSLKNTDISLDSNGRVHVSLRNDPLFRTLDEIRLEDVTMERFLNNIIFGYIRNSRWNIHSYSNGRPYTF